MDLVENPHVGSMWMLNAFFVIFSLAGAAGGPRAAGGEVPYAGGAALPPLCASPHLDPGGGGGPP
eukprot:2780270-Pyramimonas_sp.AAC.1